MSHKIGLWAAVTVIATGILITLLSTEGHPISIQGAVIERDPDPSKRAPIADVEIKEADGLAASTTRSDANGFFKLTLLPGVKPGQRLNLQFRHRDYRPFDLDAAAIDRIYVVNLTPLRMPAPLRSEGREIEISNVRVRYSIATRTAVNIGSGVKTFEVPNRGNIPCGDQPPCSPDGKWKASIGSAFLDSGEGNEFRNARLSCIAGPCPFTRVETDGFSRGGPMISVSIRNWSDTTTFLLQAEVYHRGISDSIQDAYPIILGRTLSFTLPPSAEGPSIEAELDGAAIVFPLGPIPAVSWADGDLRTAKDKSKIYRFVLRPGYRFR